MALTPAMFWPSTDCPTVNDARITLSEPAPRLAGDLSADFEAMSVDEAVEAAEQHFGIVASAQRFATEKDDTFRLDAADGKRYVLKVANPSEDRMELEFQVELLRHAERADPSLPTPRVRSGVRGQQLFKISTRAGVDRYARLMSFMAGTPLDRTSSSGRQRELIGEMLARLRLATATFSHPGDSRWIAWDVTHLLSLRDLLAQAYSCIEPVRHNVGKTVIVDDLHRDIWIVRK